MNGDREAAAERLRGLELPVSHVGNHTPGRRFISVMSRSSILTRIARPETKSWTQMFMYLASA